MPTTYGNLISIGNYAIYPYVSTGVIPKAKFCVLQLRSFENTNPYWNSFIWNTFLHPMLTKLKLIYPYIKYTKIVITLRFLNDSLAHDRLGWYVMFQEFMKSSHPCFSEKLRRAYQPISYKCVPTLKTNSPVTRKLWLINIEGWKMVAILQTIFQNEFSSMQKVCIFIQILRKFVPKGLIGNDSAFICAISILSLLAPTKISNQLFPWWSVINWYSGGNQSPSHWHLVFDTSKLDENNSR